MESPFIKKAVEKRIKIIAKILYDNEFEHYSENTYSQPVSALTEHNNRVRVAIGDHP